MKHLILILPVLFILGNCNKTDPTLEFCKETSELRLNIEEFNIVYLQIYDERGDMLKAELKNVKKNVLQLKEEESWQYFEVYNEDRVDISTLLAQSIHFNVYVEHESDSNKRFFYTFNNQFENGETMKLVRSKVLLP